MQRLKKKQQLIDLSRFDCMVKLVERERFKKGLLMLAENETHIKMYWIKQTTTKSWNKRCIKINTVNFDAN